MDWSRTHCSQTPGPGPSEQHIKRPPNRFFCFLKVWRETHHGPVKDAKKAWWELSAQERAHYQELSERKKVEHKLKYPTYRFQRRVKGRRAPKRPVIAEPARIQAAEEQIVANTSRSSGSVVHETDTQIQLSAEPSSLPQIDNVIPLTELESLSLPDLTTIPAPYDFTDPRSWTLFLEYKDWDI